MDSSTDDIPLSGAYHPFSMDGKGFSYSCNDNFKFPKDDSRFLKPVGDSIVAGIELLRKHFDSVPSEKLLITGYCIRDEKNEPEFTNLGFARASRVKDYLVSKGILPSSIDINGEIVDSWRTRGDIVQGPVRFALANAQESPEGAEGIDWNQMKERLNSDPLTLYFNVNQSQITPSDEVKGRIADLAKYLGHVPDASLIVVGHCDNTGDNAKNMALGQERADFIKAFLVQNGIDAGKIMTSSKGSREPVADNTTPEGKAKNRRTVISIL